MRNFTYITLVLLLGSSVLLAQKPSSKEIENNYIKVIIMDKGVKRTVLIPKDDIVKNKMNPMKAEQATSKDGVIVSFKDPSKTSISDFEAKYNIKLKHKLVVGYYIFTNASKFTDAQIVEEIIKNEINIETVKPNWRMTNIPQ